MGFREDLQSSLQKAACSIINDPDEDWFGGMVRQLPVVGETLAETRERGSRLARGALGCDGGFGGGASGGGGAGSSWPNNGTDGTTAGQCPASYRVTWVWDRYFNGQLVEEGDESGAPFLVTGPISSITLDPSGLYPVAVTASNPNLILFSNGSGGRVTFQNLRNIKTELASGEPDNCGSPLPTPGNPKPVPTPLPNEEDPPPETIFGPPVMGPDGSLFSPFCVNIAGIQVCGNFDFFGGPITIGYGPGKGDSGGCCDRTPGTDSPLPNTEEDPPEKDPSAPIIAVVVDATTTGENFRATEIGQIENPNVYGPRIGHIAFRIKIGDSYRWTNPMDVKGLNVYLPCPSPDGAVDVKGTADAGFNWTLTPVFATVPGES